MMLGYQLGPVPEAHGLHDFPRSAMRPLCGDWPHSRSWHDEQRGKVPPLSRHRLREVAVFG